MIDISHVTKLNPLVIDLIVREAIPETIGLSTGSYGTIVHLPDDAEAADQALASDIMEAFGNLVVTADKTTMTEGDADPIITCADASISGDADVGYVVLLDGIEYASGIDTVDAGVVTLTLASPVAGVYEVFIYRQTGNYASGSVVITVSPA